MKNTRLFILPQLSYHGQRIITFLLILFLAACNEKKIADKELIVSGSMMESRPDSALVILQQIKNPEELTEEAYATYALLLTEARDKNYVPHTSDSLISVAADYFEKSDDLLNKTKAYYYMGLVNQDLQDAPKAMEYYLKAVESSATINQNKLKSRIYNNIGSLYSFQGIYDKAIPVHKEAYRCLEMAGDSTGMPFVLRDIARIYRVQNHLDSASLYYNKAIILAESVPNLAAEVSSLTEMAELNIALGQLEKAYGYINEAIRKQPQGSDLLPSYLVLGNYYLQSEKADSARYYLTQSSQSKNIYTQGASFHYLSQLEEKKQNFEKTVFYNNLYYQCKDSIEKITDTETIRKMQSQYNYQRTANENSLLKVEKSKRELTIYQLLFLLIVLLFVGIIIMLHQRNKRQQLMRLKEKQLAFKDSQYRRSQERVEENNKQIQLLREQLSSNEQHFNDISRALIETRAELLENENSHIVKLTKENDLRNKSFIQSDIYLKLRDVSNEKKGQKMTHDDWLTLEQELDNTYNNFTMRLKKYYIQISETELQICYLVKIGLTVTSISKIIGRSKSTISMCRKRLFKKINGSDGSTEEFNDFISSI